MKCSWLTKGNTLAVVIFHTLFIVNDVILV